VTIRNILVPTDFSAHGRAALDQAVAIAGVFSARVVLLHSYWVSVSTTTSDITAMSVMLPTTFIERLREEAQAQLEDLVKIAAKAGVTCESRLTAAPPAQAILDEAHSLPADLIVMGTHGHTGLRHVLLGSVAERIVRLAACPVMTVKAPAAT
jgi:universal stress protein A